MNEERVFSKNKDGSIKVVVTYKNQEVFVPVNGEQLTIGNQNSIITQNIIDTEKFYEFMKEQQANAEQQIVKIKKELSQLEHVKDDIIPESIKLDIEKYINKKATKATNKSLMALNTYIQQVNNKRDRSRWLEQLQKQLDEITSQLAEIEKLL